MNLRSILFVAMIAVMVAAVGSPARAGLAIAENLLVFVDAQDLTPGAMGDWTNQGTLEGVFAAFGDSQVTTVDDGSISATAVTLNGGDYFNGPLTPAGVEGDGTRSIEMWVYNPDIPAEETVVAWGRRNTGDGTNLSFNYGNHGTWGAVGHWGGPDMGWSDPHAPAPAASTWHHLAYTYDGATVKLYVDGQPNTARDLALNTNSTDTLMFKIGTQNNNDAGDPSGHYFTGSIGQVRIHDGALTASEVLNNFNAGITASLTAGTLTSQASANWNLASTWDPNLVPTLEYDVVVDGEAVTVNSAEVGASLTITGGSVAVTTSILTIGGTVDASGGLLSVANGASLTAGKLATAGLSAAVGSVINVGKELNVNSTFVVTGVNLNVATAKTILAPGGTLTNTGNLSMGALTAAGGSLNLNGSTLTVGTLNVESNMNMGADLLAVTDTLNAIGGTLTVNNAVTPQILAYKGGSMAGVQVVPTVGYEVENGTVTDTLSAPVPLVVTKGTGELTGTNTYSGKTTISGGATLKVADLDTNIGAGYLEFDNGYLATSGTISRKIGTADGQISFPGNFGFSADGGDLSVTLARNDGADSPLDWNDPLNGFGGKTLLVNNLGSHTVEITNDINMDGNRTFNFGGPRGIADVGLILSGNLSGGNIRVDEHRNGNDYGVFWLAGEDLSGVGAYRLRTAGIVRFVNKDTGLTNLPDQPAFGELYFSQIETNGSFQLRGNQDLGNTTAGYICLNWGSGFSAYGNDDLTIELIGDLETDPFSLTLHSYPSGFGEMVLNSAYSNRVVTIQGDVVKGDNDDANRGNWPIRVVNNPDSDDDYARLDGNWTMESMRIHGDGSGGILELVAGNTITTDNTSGQTGQFTIQATAEFRLNGTLDMTNGGNVVVEGNSRLGGSGTVIVPGVNMIDVQGNSGVAPGDGVGTLTVQGGGTLQMDDNSIYEWEVGQPGETDLVNIVGGLLDLDNFRLRILDAGGFVKNNTDQLPVFTYGGGTSLELQLETVQFDTDELDSNLWSWTDLALTDEAGVIYLTGLSGGVSSALAWDGGEGNWSDPKWGGAAPVTGATMLIDAVGSDVSVTTTVLPAGSIAIGDTNAASLTVESGAVLSVNNDVAVGPVGTLQVDGTLTAATATVAGTLAGS
ncbi:MAG: hypothetical protein HQ567_26665, partial [Candidatus Nealsonbacteria bacterium]|nr:hypothetical protein [Candidatus Nealsonbacteria bacterium]